MAVGMETPLLDLPDDVLQMIFDAVPLSGRACLGRTCHWAWRVHNDTRFTYADCSMHRLVRRSRYCEVPHWTADVAAVFRLVRRPIFEKLRYLRIVLDAPCFEAERSPWVHPDARCKQGHEALRTLVVRANRRHYSRPSTHAVQRLLAFFPNLVSVTLFRIRNVGNDAVRTLFHHDSTLLDLALPGCSYTETARYTLVQKLTRIDTRVDLPQHLITLELTGNAATSMMRTAARLLGDNPMQLPPRLRRLDMHGALEALHELQMLLTVTFLPYLREVVVCAESGDAILALEAYKPQLFPKLCIRLAV